MSRCKWCIASLCAELVLVMAGAGFGLASAQAAVTIPLGPYVDTGGSLGAPIWPAVALAGLMIAVGAGVVAQRRWATHG